MRVIGSTLALAVCLLVGQAAFADDACGPAEKCFGSANCCGRCGKRCPCDQACKVVCDEKEVKKTVWSVECKEICTSLPGCGRGCCGCGDADCNGKCGQSCAKDGCESGGCGKGGLLQALGLGYQNVPPKCGHPIGVKTLVKKEVTCKVPSYKCVPCYACNDCYPECVKEAEAAKAKIEATPAPAPQKAPAAPKPAKQAQNVNLLPDLR